MYQRPEIVEIGHAQRLTLGGGPSAEDDNCECTKHPDVDVGVDTAWPVR